MGIWRVFKNLASVQRAPRKSATALLACVFLLPTPKALAWSQAGPGLALDAKSRENYVPFTNDKNYQHCGNDCLYARANEVLTLDASYIANRIAQVRSGQARPDPGFCLDEEDPGACDARFVRTQTITLLKIQKSYIENEDSIGRLQSKTKMAKGSDPEWDKYADREVPTVGEDPQEKNKKEQRPFVPTYDQLQMLQAESKDKMNESISTDYQNDAKDLAAFKGDGASGQAAQKPFREDFIMYKEILRDPDDALSGTLKVVVWENGKPKIDDKRYEKALAAWKNGEQQGQGQNLQKALQADGKLLDKAIEQRKKAGGNLKAPPMLPKGAKAALQGDTANMARAFADARKELIRANDTLDKQVGRRKPKSKNRGTASAPGGSLPSDNANSQPQTLLGKANVNPSGTEGSTPSGTDRDERGSRGASEQMNDETRAQIMNRQTTQGSAARTSTRVQGQITMEPTQVDPLVNDMTKPTQSQLDEQQ